jgi:YNFM family putative membrane transporter
MGLPDTTASWSPARWQYRHTALALCVLAFFATMSTRLVISPLIPSLTDTFGVGDGAIGFALTGMWGAYALLQFPSGVLADRFGEKRVILAAMAIAGTTSLLLATASTYAVFFVLAVLLGVGTGLHYTVGTTLLTKLFDGTGRAIGIHVTGGSIAGLLAPVVAAAIAVRVGWRWALVPPAAVALVIFLLLLVALRPTEPEQPGLRMRSRFRLGALRSLLGRPSIAYTTVLATVAAFAWQATASFYPTYLVATRGLSVEAASALFSLYFVVLGLFQPLSGWLSDRLGRDTVIALTMLAGVVGYGALTLVQWLPATVVAIVVTGFAMSWGGPIQSRFMDGLTDAERGTGFGLVRTVYMLVGALGSGVVGTLADLAGWTVAFGFLAALMALSLVALATNRVLGLAL